MWSDGAIFSSDDEEMFVFAAALEAEEEEEKTESRKRQWIHPINAKRLDLGEHNHLFHDLLRDEKKFVQYFRMSQPKFFELHEMIKPLIVKLDTKFRRAIPTEERLATCLRFLATGDAFVSIAFSYRLGEKTVRTIVYEVCDAIWTVLQPLYMPAPTAQDWKRCEMEYRERWNFPNCVGSIDGKHVCINKPYHSGSLYYNYKGFCSVVLLAVIDAHGRFIMIDTGGYGKNSDGSIFANCNFGKRFLQGRLDFPEDKPLPGTEEDLPHVIVGDEAFPLKPNLMRPFPGNELINCEEKKIFNLRLSRARNTSEDAFGVLSKRFRVYQRRLELKPSYVNKVVKATCCLHNFLKTDRTGLLMEIVNDEGVNSQAVTSALQNLEHVGGSFSGTAYSVRNKFKDYFLTPIGSVEWQTRAVRGGRRYE